MDNALPRREFAKYFTTDKRMNGSLFIKYVDDAPQELKELIVHIHNEHFECSLPNDWIYAVTSQAFKELSMIDLKDIKIFSDKYYDDLYYWFGYNFSPYYCNIVLKNGIRHENEIYKIIFMGQRLAKTRIYEAVNEFIQSGKK